MCGIAGIIKFSGASAPAWYSRGGDASVLRGMSAALANRGPDGEGMFIDAAPHPPAALIHRRLAIVDLAHGQQPMSNEEGVGGVHVVFNGEIYNHGELREQLQHAGHIFKTNHSDTEVLVHGWEQWDVELPRKLLGMFAFAIWDTRTDPKTGRARNTLFLARDRMGQKPLFYCPLEDGVVFASTIPAVLACPEVPRRVPMEQIAFYLQMGFFPPPQTVYRDIHQVAPGHWLRLRDDVLDGQSYWSPLHRPPGQVAHEQRIAQHELRNHLSRSVHSQLMADTPLACFLSGGIDSSIIAALMQKALLAAGGSAIQTVSVGFPIASGEFDETHYADALAQQIGSRHTRLEVNPHQDVMATLQLLMRGSLGQPFADSSILPSYHLSKAVRQIAPTALSGDGADELFAGYDRYRALNLLANIKPLAPLMPKSLPVGPLVKRERYRRLALAGKEKNPADRYTHLLEIFPGELREKIFDEASPYMAPPAHGEPEQFRAAMFRDQVEYLPGDILYKLDSASMQSGLEVRSPFLDHHLVEFANALPDGLLIRQNIGKYLLRETFAPELPALIRTRPKKGFGVPIGQWFAGDLKSSLTDMLFSSGSFTTTHLHKPAVERMLSEHLHHQRDHTHRLFSLLMLELWHGEFKPAIEAAGQ